MRAHIVPPYPSFTDVMSQLGDSSHEGQAGDSYCGVPVKPVCHPTQGATITYPWYADVLCYKFGRSNNAREPRATAGGSPRVATCTQGVFLSLRR